MVLWRVTVVGNHILVYQMSQILPCANFRNGTHIFLWGVTQIDFKFTLRVHPIYYITEEEEGGMRRNRFMQKYGSSVPPTFLPEVKVSWFLFSQFLYFISTNWNYPMWRLKEALRKMANGIFYPYCTRLQEGTEPKEHVKESLWARNSSTQQNTFWALSADFENYNHTQYLSEARFNTKKKN